MEIFTPEMVTLIRAQANEAAQQRVISTEVLQFIYAECLFKLFVPAELNGRMETLPDALKIFEAASRIDGSFGWLVTMGSGGGYFASFFQPATAQKLFSPANAVVAGSGMPTGKAAPHNGGYSVTGQWRFCSGANYANMFTANCIMNDDGHYKAFIFLPEQVQIINDWNAFGLQATASHTIQVTNAVVGEEMVFDLANGPRYFDNPIYRYPFLQFAETSFAAVAAGIATNFYDETFALTQQSAVYWDKTNPGRSAFVKALATRQVTELGIARHIFYNAVYKSWETLLSNGQIPGNELTAVTVAVKNLVAVALAGVQQVFPYLGMGVLMQSNTINRIYRNLHTASQHILLKNFNA